MLPLHRIKRLIAKAGKFFGDRCVQSPYIYTFICDVLTNTTPFQAYADMKSQLDTLTPHKRKEAKMLLRLANHIQPAQAWIPAHDTHLAPFIRRGCRATDIHHYSNTKQITQGPGALIYIDSRSSTPHTHLHTPAEGSAVVVTHIYRSTQDLNLWRQTARQPWATLTFDTGYAGIALVKQHTHHKQHYTI